MCAIFSLCCPALTHCPGSTNVYTIYLCRYQREYTHPSLFTGLYFAAVQICEVASRIKIKTWALQWIGAPKLFNKSNTPLSHTT
jgi:hypothetical protein